MAWKDTILDWVNNSRRIMVSHYEDREANTYQELIRIVRFLGVPVQQERLLCAVQECPTVTSSNWAGMNHRSYLEGSPYPTKVKKLLDKNIQEVNATLIRYNLRPLPNNYHTSNVF